MMKLLIIFTFLICVSICFPENDLVNLNVINNIYPYNSSDIYAGYLPVNARNKELYYIFVKSEKKNIANNQIPLIIWYNGGPGCSSLIGFLNENGPAITIGDNSDKLKINIYSWNKLAHVLYIDSPAGTGFSKAFDDDLFTNDEITTKDNLNALNMFFQKFPELKQNEIILTGESYAGIYIPHLASAIIDYNLNLKTDDQKIKLKGVFIGNPYTDKIEEYDNSMLKFMFNHGLYSKDKNKEFDEKCLSKPWLNNSEECESVKSQIFSEVGDIWYYDISKKCYTLETYKKTGWFKRNLLKNYKRNLSQVEKDDCVYNKGTTDYLNSFYFKKAFNIPTKRKWEECTDSVTYYSGNLGSFHLYPKLIDENIKIWIYSGDLDAVVPYNGTIDWIERLNLTVKEKWSQWKIKSDEVAGYKIIYENNFAFFTLRNAGHMVPQYKSEEVFYLLEAYLYNKSV
jgi:carboxypeptidase C (cathepsin A)